MTDYTELVKALTCGNDGKLPCHSNECPYWVDQWHGIGLCNVIKKDADAAAAIEALNRLLDQNTQRCEALRKQLREAHESYERHLNELEAQLPKRGKWIVHTEVKNIYGGICIECPVCRDHFVVLNVSDEKYCRSCGAKMEVQE